MNRAEKFEKDVQITFFKRKDLSYVQDRNHMSRT